MKETGRLTELFKEVVLEADYSLLPGDIINALPHLRKAMDIITQIFLRQQDEKLPEHYSQVMEGDDGPLKRFYSLFKGPYNPFAGYRSISENIKDRRKGCGFYPDNLSDKEIIRKIENLEDGRKLEAKDHFTVIREMKGELEIIPYHVYYSKELALASGELVKASEIVENRVLKNYLRRRASSLLDGTYRESDSEWVRMTRCPLDLVIGPYEVYADSLLGLKATYESMLMIVDHRMGDELKEIENNLGNLSSAFPLPCESEAAVGGLAPIVVVHQIYSGGEASQGIMAAAFNLPNDAWVRGNVGWKQVMLYNVMKAKFEAVTSEIAEAVIEGGSTVDFKPFFTFVLLHEVSHGLGPAYRKGGVPVSKCLGSSYAAVEETKADIGSLFLMLKFGGSFGIAEYDKEVLLKTCLSGIFRAIRFGASEAHGLANLVQFNWLREKKIITSAGGKFNIKPDGALKAAEELLEKVCSLEACGSENEAVAFLSAYGEPDKDVLDAVEMLSSIPIDIRVIYPE